MTVQWLAVSIIVPLCALYAVWNLLGAAARRRVSIRLAAWRLPAAWTRRLQAGDPASTCGCDGCEQAGQARKEQPAAQSIVRLHRRNG
ncbi:MAG TPA: hypothetical protein VLJ62_00480 [Burkholderiaceae bacterium]|nr:hypothetical protein [Burkholderiaceae bacterium]